MYGRDEALRLKNDGTTAYRNREFAKALEKYTAAREANPDPAEISFQLNEAAVYFEMKDYAKTIEVCYLRWFCVVVLGTCAVSSGRRTT